MPFDAPVDDLAPRLDGVDAVLLGPGLDDPGSTRRLLQAIADHVAADTPVVLDAFALGVLAKDDGIERTSLPAALLMTPNPDEAERLLTGEASVDLDDGATVAATLASRYDSVVAFQRHIADPSGGSWFIPDGNPGLGTSGSGDVLAGALVGLLARGATSVQAACWATYLHAAAGDRLAGRVGRVGFLARELLDELPRVIELVENG